MRRRLRMTKNTTKVRRKRKEEKKKRVMMALVVLGASLQMLRRLSVLPLQKGHHF